MRRRRRYRQRRAGSLSPLAIAGICIAAVLLLTVLVGNLLTLWLDDETYARLTQGSEEAPAEEVLHKSNVPDAHAYPYLLSDDPTRALEFPALSIPLNKPDGSLYYTSDVSTLQGLTGDKKVPLFEKMQTLSLYTTYVSGIFYPQALAYETDDLRFAATAAEGALLREFAHCGAKDLLLMSIPFDRLSVTEILSYAKALKSALGDTPLGIAVPLSLAQSAGGWETLNALLEVFDFCALDLTAADAPREDGSRPSPIELLNVADYFLTQYDMRLLLSQSQTDLIAEAEIRMIPDYQILAEPAT